MSSAVEPVTNAPPPGANPATTPMVAAPQEVVMQPSMVEPFEIEARDSVDSSDILDGIASVHVRHGFVRKVYAIVAIQLMITFAVGCVIVANADAIVKALGVMGVRMLFYASLSITMMCLCAFYCCQDLVRKFPTNYILLLTFTLFESIMVGFICTLYETESVLIALGITFVVVFALTAFACQTKYDFTGAGPYLFGAVIVLSCLGMVCMVTMLSGATSELLQPLRLVYASVGALVMCMYIVYDTQLIIGDKHHTIRFSEDDYVLAAINLYVDIVELFLYLLEIFGSRSGN